MRLSNKALIPICSEKWVLLPSKLLRVPDMTILLFELLEMKFRRFRSPHQVSAWCCGGQPRKIFKLRFEVSYEQRDISTKLPFKFDHESTPDPVLHCFLKHVDIYKSDQANGTLWMAWNLLHESNVDSKAFQMPLNSSQMLPDEEVVVLLP